MKSCWIVTRDYKAVLEWRDVPVPQPAKGELVIRVRATAMNRGELVVGSVVHGGPEKIGGNEAAGEVHTVGEGVTAFRPGDRVFGRVRGGFAQYATVFEHQALEMPQRLTWEEAAAGSGSLPAGHEIPYTPH